MERGLYYHDYLQLDRLLSAQELESSRRGKTVHDEMLFVIVHQAYELWFKQILWELDDILLAFSGDVLDEHDTGRVVSRLGRISAIQRLLSEQIEVLETMTPIDFLDFRDYLVPASGFQSVQFRLIENRMGVRPQDRLLFEGAPYTHRLSDAHRRQVEQSEEGPSLHGAVERWLARTPFLDEYGFWDDYARAVRSMLAEDRKVIESNPNLGDDERAEQLRSFDKTIDQFEAAFDPERHHDLREAGLRRFSHRAFQGALFISLYRDEPALQEPYRLLESLIDVDEGFAMWRYRHALMVQRMIGAKVGTGGSAGAKYLLKLAERTRAFPDLLLLPTFLVPRAARPELPANVVSQMRFRYQP
ncbi:MAG: tryptophan 2,3-dioxygenase family protein [Actinomycetota bacterium]